MLLLAHRFYSKSYLLSNQIWVEFHKMLSEIEEHWIKPSDISFNFIRNDSILFNFTQQFVKIQSIWIKLHPISSKAVNDQKIEMVVSPLHETC